MDHIRYLRCRSCGHEFSERKGSALWNTKVSEEQAESVAAHLAEGCSLSATTRLVKVDRSVVTPVGKTWTGVSRHTGKGAGGNRVAG
jgi:transposase-like protein